jgi:hypothetical protein
MRRCAWYANGSGLRFRQHACIQPCPRGRSRVPDALQTERRILKIVDVRRDTRSERGREQPLLEEPRQIRAQVQADLERHVALHVRHKLAVPEERALAARVCLARRALEVPHEHVREAQERQVVVHVRPRRVARGPQRPVRLDRRQQRLRVVRARGRARARVGGGGVGGRVGRLLTVPAEARGGRGNRAERGALSARLGRDKLASAPHRRHVDVADRLAGHGQVAREERDERVQVLRVVSARTVTDRSSGADLVVDAGLVAEHVLDGDGERVEEVDHRLLLDERLHDTALGRVVRRAGRRGLVRGVAVVRDVVPYHVREVARGELDRRPLLPALAVALIRARRPERDDETEHGAQRGDQAGGQRDVSVREVLVDKRDR